jgi:hypothetical protein
LAIRWFSFVLSVRFWLVAWIALLLIGLMPLPPLAELVIVVGCVAHGVWFVQHRLRVIAISRADARADADGFRRRDPSRAFRVDLPHTLAQAEPGDPTHDSEFRR